MDVNINPDITKVTGVPVTPSPVELEDATKPQVPPVPENSSATEVELSNRALHDNEERTAKEQQEQARKDIEKAAKEIDDRFQALGTSFSFGLYNDRKADTIVGQLKDKETGKVVKQIPSEEVLKLREKIKELAGIIFEDQA